MDNNEPPRSRTKRNAGEVKNKNNIGKKELKKRKSQKRWIITAFALSFSITAVLSLGSGEVVSSLSIYVAIPVLLLIVFIGIIFDIIGLSVAIADIKPFNSMATRRLNTGKKAVWLVLNAEKVSSFCCDLVGDIAGVLSGATGAAIAVKLFTDKGNVLLTIAMTSLIAATTVGFKAVGKLIAVKYSEKIVFYTARVLCGFKK